MSEFSVQSYQSEAQQIIRNCLNRLEQLVEQRRPGLYRQTAVASDVSDKSRLSLEKLDHMLFYLRQEVPGITLELFSNLSLMDLGLIGYAAASADTVGDALKIVNNYHSLTSDRFRPDMEVDSMNAHVIPIPNPSFTNDMKDIAEDHLAGTWNLIRQFLGSRANSDQIQVSLAYAPPSYQPLYENIFGKKVDFYAARTELVFPSSWLDLPVASANPEMSKLTSAVCERIMGPVSSRPDTITAVHSMLLSRQGRAVPSVESAAKMLNLSTEQFRKRLWRQGSNYKSLVLESRMILGKNYLEATILSVQEIAYLLDYSHPGAFTRAFKKYYGIAPQFCREQGMVLR